MSITVGVLTPHARPGPEVELPDLAPGQVVVRVSRVGDAPAPPTSPGGLRALTTPPVLDRAAAALGPVDVIAYASTSTGYAVGFEAESVLVQRLSQRWSVPVVSTTRSAVAALRALRVRRVALVHPPWFDDELNDLGAAYFRAEDFEVVSSESVEDVDRISRHVGDDAEAVFIGGNGFRAARAIATLEERLRRPVLESNQVLLSAILGDTPGQR